MASLRRLPTSSKWIACFTGADGKRYQRSTGILDDRTVESRRRAQRVADDFEDVARRKKTARQIQQVIHDLFEETQSEKLPNSTVRDFAERWLKERAGEVAERTFAFYKGKVHSFIAFLKNRAERPIGEIRPDDVRNWRDLQSSQVTASTVNHGLKCVRMMFRAAVRENLLADNPAEKVGVVKRSTASARRPFSMGEIKALLSAADEEWRSMILFGLYTGQRLGDLALLTWHQIDMEAQEIRLTTGKTGRNQKIPIPLPLMKHIQALPKPSSLDAPLHPRANITYLNQGKVGTLSRQFYEVMVAANLAKKKSHHATSEAGENPGRAGKRNVSKISFHSLRHTTTSLLKNAGVSPSIAEEFVGHDSVEMNRVYTHIELDSMKRAAALLPDVLI